MKNLKKLASITLVLVLALAMMATAFASTINVRTTLPDGSTTGETYTAYKVFDVVIGGNGVPNDTDPHSYTISSKIGDKVNPFYTVVNNSGYFDLTQIGTTDTYNVTPKNTYNSDAAAALTTQLLEAVNSDVPVAATTSTFTAIPNEENTGVYSLTGLDAGYYLITSTLGSKMIVDTVGAGNGTEGTDTITINAKNEYPTLTKTVLDGETYAESTTASYGETVTFKIDVNVPATANKPIVVHDIMSQHLTYVAQADGSMIAETNVKKADFADTCTQEFTIPLETVNANKGNTVSIIYTTTLNAGAPTGQDIVNDSYLTYSKYTSKHDDAKVQTYEFDLVKTKADFTVLPEAKFTLSDGSTPLYFTLDGNAYSLAKSTDADATTTITAGNVTIKGLGNGTYTLTETAAPTGYNKLEAPISVEISGKNRKANVVENKYAESTEANPNDGIQVINRTGTELPSTGGIGTTIFYIVGGLLVVGACILLITKQRVKAD